MPQVRIDESEDCFQAQKPEALTASAEIKRRLCAYDADQARIAELEAALRKIEAQAHLGTDNLSQRLVEQASAALAKVAP